MTKSAYDVGAVSLDLDGCCFPKNKFPESSGHLVAYLDTPEARDSIINLSPYLGIKPPLVFAVNTGRAWSATYPVVQAIGGDGKLIVAVEHGHGIRMPGEERPVGADKIDSKYEPDIRTLNEIRDALYRDPNIETHKIDKDFFVAVRVPRDADQTDFKRMVLDRLGPHREMVESGKGDIVAVYSHGAIDIRSKNLTKGNALKIVSSRTGVPLENWLAIEDADKAVLVDEKYQGQRKLVGYAGCPADASEDVRRVVRDFYVLRNFHNSDFPIASGQPFIYEPNVGCVAKQENGRGTLEVLKHFLGD